MNLRFFFKILLASSIPLIIACTDNWPPINSVNTSNNNSPNQNPPLKNVPNNDTSKVQVVVENELFGVLYSNGKYIATGEAEEVRNNGWAVPMSGIILSSPDSLSWTKRDSSTTNTFFGAAYGDNLFVVVGSNGIVLTSPDGTPGQPEFQVQCRILIASSLLKISLSP